MEHKTGGKDIFFSPPQGSRRSEHPLRLLFWGTSDWANYSVLKTQARPGLISAATQWPEEAESQGLSPQGSLKSVPGLARKE